MDLWPLFEKVQRTLQMVGKYTADTLPKNVRLDPLGYVHMCVCVCCVCIYHDVLCICNSISTVIRLQYYTHTHIHVRLPFDNLHKSMQKHSFQTDRSTIVKYSQWTFLIAISICHRVYIYIFILK